jgi:hypothetical protein
MSEDNYKKNTISTADALTKHHIGHFWSTVKIIDL